MATATKRTRGQTRRVGAILLTAALLGGTYTAVDFTTHSIEAQAATAGVGDYDGTGVGIGSLIHENGTIVYCMEFGLPVADGDAPLVPATSLPAYTTGGYWNLHLGVQTGPMSVGALTGDGVKILQFILGKYGNTSDAHQAAAVQLAIWDYRGQVGGDATYNNAIAQAKSAMSSHGFGDSVSSAASMIQEAQNWLAAGGGGTGVPGGTQPGDPVLKSTSPYHGTVDVKAGTETVTIENGVFIAQNGVTVSADGRTATITDGEAHTISWEGRPPAGEAYNRYYRVSVAGTWAYDKVTKVPGELLVSENGSNQSFTTGTAPKETVERVTGDFEAQYTDPDTLWAPELVTEVKTKVIKAGQKFSDTVTFSASDKIGSGNYPVQTDQWRSAFKPDGSKVFAPITAHGTLYGPFLQDPALNPSATPPAGSPVAGTAKVTTSEATGPGTYDVETDFVSEETGYYTWVWTIDADKQLDAIKNPPTAPNGKRAMSIPTNYHFTDGFGTAAEGQVSAQELEINTKLSASKVTIGDSFTDNVTVDLVRGGWLQGADGKRIPYTLRGTAYLSDKKPAQQADVPADAKVLGSVTADVNKPATEFKSKSFTVPLATKANYVTVQWCALPEDQTGEAKDKIVETCDDYGVPAETAQIQRPEVTTQAQENGAVYGDISDTAVVTGAMPKDIPAEVDFTAYLKPEVGQPKYDENWEKVLGADGKPVLWTAEEVSDPNAVCDAQPVAQTDPVAVDGVGTYQSPTVVAESAGTVYWVENLTFKPKDGDPVTVHTGKCGLPNETTEVSPPKVTTQAQPEGAVKGDIHDVAKVDGPLSTRDDVKYEVDFTAYLKPVAGEPKYDENWKPVLDENGKPVLWTETEVSDPDAVCEAQPVGKTDRVEVDGEGEFKSPTIKAETEGTVYWVEELFVTPEDEEPESLHRGKCGLPNETTEVEKPKVTTKATPDALPGDKIHDTAIVDGPLSKRDDVSYEVTFEAYHRESGTTEAPNEDLCTPDTKVWESESGTKVTKTGEWKSEEMTVKPEHVGEILWVETLWVTETDEDGKETKTELHRGKCGEVDEITRVRAAAAAAANTGTDSAAMIGWGAAGLLALAAAGGVAMIRRNKKSATSEGAAVTPAE